MQSSQNFINRAQEPKKKESREKRRRREDKRTERPSRIQTNQSALSAYGNKITNEAKYQ